MAAATSSSSSATSAGTYPATSAATSPGSFSGTGTTAPGASPTAAAASSRSSSAAPRRPPPPSSPPSSLPPRHRRLLPRLPRLATPSSTIASPITSSFFLTPTTTTTTSGSPSSSWYSSDMASPTSSNIPSRPTRMPPHASLTPTLSSGSMPRLPIPSSITSYMMLNRQYRNLKQGDLSVAEYARRMKLLTAGLADIDHAVTEVDLTTQFLHGLDKRLDTIRVVLGDTVPLPPLETVFSRVKLAEENLAQRAADESAMILAVTGSGAAPGSSSGHNTERGARDGDRPVERNTERGHR